MYEDVKAGDIDFLFETNKWNGSKIENMTNSHIINSILMLRRRASEFKQNYEWFLLDNQNHKLLTLKDDLSLVLNMDTMEWMENTPIYLSLINELEKRNVIKFLNVIIERNNI